MRVLAGPLAVLLVAAAWRVLRGGPATGRLRRTSGAAPRAPARAVPQPVLACAVAAAAAVLLLPLPLGLVVGAAVAVAGPRLLGRLEPRAAREEQEQLLADLPLLLDLLAACLAGGAGLQDAARAVSGAVPGAAGRRLAAVGSAVAVGTAPADAWLLLGAADADPLRAAAQALSRAAGGGAPVAGAVSRLAADARADARGRSEQAARRAGVLAVAPLGLCFLPAFVLLGVVPVVVGLAGPLLAQL